jgi:phthiocerol/phenolphthiocerol synthesis type-I polyketide synthase E
MGEGNKSEGGARMNQDIAIIGIAGRFPGAADIDELRRKLENARDSVGEISSRRLKDTELPLDREYIVCGYLEDIDRKLLFGFGHLPGKVELLFCEPGPGNTPIT